MAIGFDSFYVEHLDHSQGKRIKTEKKEYRHRVSGSESKNIAISSSRRYSNEPGEKRMQLPGPNSPNNRYARVCF